MPFDKERFIADCRRALGEADAKSAVEEIIRRAVSDPGQVVQALGEPREATFESLYNAPDLTICNVLWGPGMDFYPHDHHMWAIIGVYGGQEDNAFYRRGDDGLTRHGVREVASKDTIVLGESAIHSVANPLGSITAGIHVYGGDLYTVSRSEWDPVTFEERPFDDGHALRLFEESNRRLRSST